MISFFNKFNKNFIKKGAMKPLLFIGVDFN